MSRICFTKSKPDIDSENGLRWNHTFRNDCYLYRYVGSPQRQKKNNAVKELDSICFIRHLVG